MAKKHRVKKEQTELPKNLLCNKSDEELIELINDIQDGINSSIFSAYDIILKDTVTDVLEDRGYVVSEIIVVQHASELASEEHWGKGKGEDEEDKKKREAKLKADKEGEGKGADVRAGDPGYAHLADPDWPEN